MGVCFQAVRILDRGWLGLAIVIALLASDGIGQTANPFFFNQTGTIKQVSLSKGISPDRDGEPQTETKQLRIAIRYLLVDDATRREIYAHLPTDSVRHATHAPTDPPGEALAEGSEAHRCVTEVSAHGHSATCVIDSGTASELVRIATESPACTVSQAPGLILQPDRAAEIRDLVQRPMVVDVQREGDLFKPVIRLVDEGTRMRMLGRLIGQGSSGYSVRLTTEFLDIRILAIHSTEILGLQETPTTVQNPLSQITSVVATEQLRAGELLLIDPHVKKSTTVDFEADTMLGKLPVVGRAFAETESKSVENHLLVLVRPTAF